MVPFTFGMACGPVVRGLIRNQRAVHGGLLAASRQNLSSWRFLLAHHLTLCLVMQATSWKSWLAVQWWWVLLLKLVLREKCWHSLCEWCWAISLWHCSWTYLMDHPQIQSYFRGWSIWLGPWQWSLDSLQLGWTPNYDLKAFVWDRMDLHLSIICFDALQFRNDKTRHYARKQSYHSWWRCWRTHSRRIRSLATWCRLWWLSRPFQQHHRPVSSWWSSTLLARTSTIFFPRKWGV